MKAQARDAFAQRVFDGTSAWNRKLCAGDAVDADSDARLALMHELVRIDLQTRLDKKTTKTAEAIQHAEAGSIYINCEEYSVPIFQAQGTRQVEVELATYCGETWQPRTCTFEYERRDGKYFAKDILQPGRLVQRAAPDGEDSDGHLVVLSEDGETSYEFFQARVSQKASDGRRIGDIRSAGSIAVFKTQGSGSQYAFGEKRSGTRASGLSLLGGLLLPESFAGDRIPHALAASFPKLRFRGLDHDPGPNYSGSTPNWVDPASRSEDHVRSTLRDPLVLAAGERLRLKSTAFTPCGRVFWQASGPNQDLSMGTMMVLQALHEFGLLVVDASIGWTLYAEADSSAGMVDVLSGARREQLAGAKREGGTTWLDLIEAIRKALSGSFGLVGMRDGKPYANFEVVSATT